MGIEVSCDWRIDYVTSLGVCHDLSFSLGVGYADQTKSISLFCKFIPLLISNIQTDLSTGLKVEESCYAQASVKPKPKLIQQHCSEQIWELCMCY